VYNDNNDTNNGLIQCWVHLTLCTTVDGKWHVAYFPSMHSCRWLQEL